MRRWLLAGLMLWSVAVWAGTVEVQRGCEITWDANTEPDLAGYRVYTRQGGGVYTSTFYAVTPPDVTVSCTELGLTQGVYHIRITAVDSAEPPNESVVSNELTVDVRVPVRAR